VRFVIDSHLGKLARHLRLLGFDCTYKNFFPDNEIVDVAQQERRIILTRDIGLLKHKRVQWGYWLKATDPNQQLKEVVKRYQLHSQIKPFSRCLECNGKIKRIAKNKVIDQLPQAVRENYTRFYLCRLCQKIYWQGSHYEKLLKIIKGIQRHP
jgi:uncharacterized protein with PIN domain